jgi:hypothetical protein
MNRCHVIVAVVAALAGPVAKAETVYRRCGHEYSDVACARGVELDVGAAPSAQRLAEARQVALSEKRLAAEMTNDRREREAALRPAVATAIGHERSPEAQPATKAKAKHVKRHAKGSAPDDERDFIAAVPKAKKAGG